MTSTPGSGAVKKRAWVWSKTTLAEEELKQCTERYRTLWKSAEKRTEVRRRRGLTVMPEQQHKASEHGTGRGRLHAPGQRKRLGHRRGRDDKPLGQQVSKGSGEKDAMPEKGRGARSGNDQWYWPQNLWRIKVNRKK